MLIEMKVASLTVDPFTNMPILILQDPEGGKMPLWIGVTEASAIAAELESIRLDRPMTHDLMKTILGLCSVAVERVEVHDIKASTFFATLFLRRPDGEVLAVDARPSDAIALALRARAPIYVARKVIDRARRDHLPVEILPEGTPRSQARKIALEALDGLETLAAPAFGKWKM
jgi:bifunctional DNase/RNase